MLQVIDYRENLGKELREPCVLPEARRRVENLGMSRRLHVFRVLEKRTRTKRENSKDVQKLLVQVMHVRTILDVGKETLLTLRTHKELRIVCVPNKVKRLFNSQSISLGRVLPQ